MAGAFGAGKDFTFTGLQRPKPETNFAVGFVNGRDDVTAVGGNGGDTAFIGFNGSELRFFRREKSGTKRVPLDGGGVRGFEAENVGDGDECESFDDVRSIFSEFVGGLCGDGAGGFGAGGGSG